MKLKRWTEKERERRGIYNITNDRKVLEKKVYSKQKHV